MPTLTKVGVLMKNDYHRAALWFNKNFGMTCIPMIGKAPLVEWEYLKRPISTEEIDSMITSRAKKPAWECATGLNGICGVNDLALVDGDNVTDEAMQIIADKLGLSKSQWRSGGPERGWRHLWVIAPGLADMISVGKVDQDARPEYEDGSGEHHHIEIRHRGHYGMLPPSKHPNRPGKYAFANGWPKEPPPVVDPAALLAAWESVTVPKPKPTRTHTGVMYDSNGDDKAVHIARECLKRLASWRADDYSEWIKVGMSLCSLGGDGLALWDQWSSQSPKYKPGICDKAWRFLSPEKGITQATLTYLANEDSPHSTPTLVSVGINSINLKSLLLPTDALNAINGYAATFGEPRPARDRSTTDWIAIKWLVKRGATDDQIISVFKQYPIGRGKYAERGDTYLIDTITKARLKFKSMP